VSLAAYMWAADLPLDACGPTAFRVLLKYADRVDELGYHGWHTEEFLADRLGCSTRTIRRARLELVSAGLLRLSDEQEGPRAHAGHRAKVYDVLTTALRVHESGGGTFLSWNQMRGGTSAGPVGGQLLSIQTALETTYQDFSDHPSLATARESASTR
jgi:hypothetical protein